MIKEISSENCDVVIMKIDNVSDIQLEKNPIAHSRRNLPYKAGQLGNLSLLHCENEEQIADLLTKVVTVQVFQKLRDQIGMETLANLN